MGEEHGTWTAYGEGQGTRWLGKIRNRGGKCLGEEQGTGEAMVERSRNRGSNCTVKRARNWCSTDRGLTKH